MDLPHGMDCNKRSLLLNSTQAKGILLDFMNLYELIQSRSIEYDGKSYSLLDVCEKPDGETGNCKVDIQDNNCLKGYLLTRCHHLQDLQCSSLPYPEIVFIHWCLRDCTHHCSCVQYDRLEGQVHDTCI